MPDISDYLWTNSSGLATVSANTWVRLTSNKTGTTYISTAATDANGKFTITGVPGGTYTVATGPTNTGPWTGTGNTNYMVEPVDASGNETILGNTTINGTLAVSTGPLTLPSASIADSSLSNNVALLNGTQTITGLKTYNNSVIFNNTFSVEFKDTAGTAINVLQDGSDNIVRLGWLSAPVSNGHLILYANGSEALRFTPASATKLSLLPLQIGTGDSLGYAANLLPQNVDIRIGTAGTPDTVAQPMLKLSRTINLQTSQIVGDGADSGAGIASYITTGTTGQVQPVAVLGYGSSASTDPATSPAPDATGGYFVGRILTGGTHTGIGSFHYGRTDGASTSRANGAEIAVMNNRGADAASITGGFSNVVGLWIHSDSVSSLYAGGDGIEFGVLGSIGQQFDVGIHFNGQIGGSTNQFTGGIKTASIRDESTSVTSIDIKGTHTTALSVAAGGGNVLIGETAAMSTGVLFEVKGPASTQDPIAYFGNTGSLQAYGVRIGNNNGVAIYWVSAGVNNFTTGSIAGDAGIKQGATNKFFHLGGSATSIRVGNDNTVQFMASTATPAGGSAAASVGFGSGPGPSIFFGSGVPTVSGKQGSLYLRTDGVTQYNTNGTTGWAPLQPDAGVWTPSDHGFLTWNYDPVNGQGGTALTTAGTVYVNKIHLRTPQTITNVCGFINVSGSGLTAAQCFAALYDSTGTLLSATADQSTAWGTTTGKQIMALSVAQSVNPGDYYVAFLFNGTTGPSFFRGVGSSFNNVNLSAAASRWATGPTLQTSMPNSLGTLTASNNSYWVALS